MAHLMFCFYFFFFLFPSLISSLDLPSCNHHDYSSLLQFKNSFSLNSSASEKCDYYHQSSYPKTASWGNVSNCCLWDGVTCDSMSGHVMGINLSCSWLHGQFHPNSTLFQLSHLQTLNLAHNNFNRSSISSQFGDLPNLMHLNLSESCFAGEISPKISQLSKLVSLDLSRNGFEDSFEMWSSLRLEPSTWEKLILNTTNLRELVLDDVNMSSITQSSLSLLMNLSSSLVSLRLGNTKLQENITNIILCLQNLQQLDLSLNENLKARLPKSNWSSPLRYLDLSDIAFSEEALTSICHLKSLNILSLMYRQFEGPIPPCFKNLTQLTYLNLGLNKFSGEISFISNLHLLTSLILFDNNFTGQIPPSLSNLEHLTHLVLSENYFTGEIPNVFKKLSKLETLSLSQNKLQGDFPELIFGLTNLSFLYLSSNNLSGLVNFQEFLKLQNLKELDLSNNKFLLLNFDDNANHTIPNLKSLDLSSCHINSFPKFLSLLPNLIFLNLFDNKLQGNFPELIFGLTNLSFLHLSSNNLSGPINFHQFSKLQNLEHLDLSNNKFLSLRFDNNVNYTIPNLQRLDLSSCNINSFPNLFSNLPNLKYLNLSNNIIHGKIPKWFNYVGNGSLQYLDLSHNILTSVEHLSNNVGNGSLHYLDLSHNILTSVENLSMGNLWFLDLSFNMLQGNLHERFNNVGNGSLEHLDLSHNILTSVKHLSIGNIWSLDLSFNMLQGNLHEWFNNIENGSLHYLDLSHNNLTLVKYLSMRNVIFLDLSFNLLQGNLPIPHFGVRFFSVSNNNLSGDISSLFCNASSLMILNLSYNNLSGLIPQCLIAIPYLSALDLQMNNFVGTIPNNFSKSNSLQTLHFNNNQLEGLLLPRSLAHCNQLEILDVGDNKIKDTFPNWLEGLPELQVLILRDNNFYGAISSSNTKHPFSRLRIFDVSNNHFSGSLPTVYIKKFKGMMEVDNVATGLQYMENKNYSSYEDSVMLTWKGTIIELQRILTIFTTIDLSNNMFDGKIPQVIGELHSLIGLNLSHNRITGSIPQSMGNLTSLEWLDLSSNKLIGEIPQALTNLNFLSILNLSQNQLQGIIPRGKQFDTFQNDSYKGNVGLCGAPLSKTCSKDDGKLPQPSTLAAGEFRFGWKPVAFGYGCGMAFGMLMGYIVFSIGKPQWLVRIFEGEPKKLAKRTRNITHAN